MQQRIGIVCDMDYSWCFNLKQYYHVIKSLYGSLKIVSGCDDLDDIDLLFIGDDHTVSHKKVITQKGFVEKCNEKDIRVVVFTSERIFDSFFPWNVDNYNFIKRFDNLYHYTADVDDCKKLGTKLHRLTFSKYYKDFIEPKEKKDAVVFIGHVNTNCYQERMGVINKIKEFMPVDIIPPTMNKWETYLNALAGYRFVLSPIGNGNIFTFRFYEALLVHSIPIHQVRENTLEYYDIESKFTDCIYFKKPEELRDMNCLVNQSSSEIWSEDYLEQVLKEDGLL